MRYGKDCYPKWSGTLHKAVVVYFKIHSLMARDIEETTIISMS
jgi:hypothetical protein